MMGVCTRHTGLHAIPISTAEASSINIQTTNTMIIFADIGQDDSQFIVTMNREP
jgi:hypothetical protein